MPVPKRKTSKTRKRTRRAHHAIGKPNLRPCSNCGSYGLPHRVCSACGHYKGRLIVMPKVKKAKENTEAAG